MKFSTILKTIKPFMGGVTVTIDRNRQEIHFTRNGSTEILTVDQLFTEIETIFSSAKSAGQVKPELVRTEQNGAPWLTNCNKPQLNALGI